jgi:hypothetical protein
LSADDRFEEIKRLLDSTVSEFQSLFESAGGFEDSRVGNGWNPEKIVTEIYFLQPKPLSQLTKIAEERKRSLFRNRIFSFLKPPEHEVQLVGKPSLKLISFWLIKGFHECFYFRGSSYKIDLPEDVVAVEVEGKIRDLVGRESSDSQSITGLTRRLLGRREWAGVKSFHLNDVTELAYMYKEGSFFVNAEGKEDLEAEAFFEGKPPLQEMSHQEVARQFPDARLAPTSMSKEELVRRLHALIVRPPASFSKILSNRFQITTLAEYLMPVFSFTFECRGQRKELLVHGFTGGFF